MVDLSVLVTTSGDEPDEDASESDRMASMISNYEEAMERLMRMNRRLRSELAKARR